MGKLKQIVTLSQEQYNTLITVGSVTSGTTTVTYDPDNLYLTPNVSMVGASSSAAGSGGLVPAPASGDESKFLRGDGTWQIVSAGATYTEATTSAAGLMSSSDKSKLDGIASGANNYTHPSYTSYAAGLYKVTIDSEGHVSTVTTVAKSDITALGIPSSDTTYSEATTSAAGLMSTDDKIKLNGIASGANNYTHPSHTAQSSGLYKVTVDSEGHVSAATAVQKSDITELGIPSSDTTYTTFTGATTSDAGAAGLVPGPASGDIDKYLCSDGTWVQTATDADIDAIFTVNHFAAGQYF